MARRGKGPARTDAAISRRVTLETSVHSNITIVFGRLDRIEIRLDRIERRLQLQDAPAPLS